MTFKEHIKMERRALKELWQHHRTYVICMCLFFVFQAAYPYIPTYFSAEIINNLYVLFQSFLILTILLDWIIIMSC